MFILKFWEAGVAHTHLVSQSSEQSSGSYGMFTAFPGVDDPLSLFCDTSDGFVSDDAAAAKHL